MAEETRTLRERAYARLGLVTEARLAEEVTRAYEAGVDMGLEDEPPPSSRWADRWGYTQVNQGARDIAALTYHEAVERVWAMYIRNPLAKRLQDTRRDHTVTATIRPVCADPDVQAWVDKFWDDEDNDMSSLVFAFGLECGLFGMQVYPVRVNLRKVGGGQVGDGFVLMGHMDPAQVKDILFDEFNPRRADAIQTLDENRSEQFWRVIHKDRRLESPTYDRYVGVFAETPESDNAVTVYTDEDGAEYSGAVFLFRLNHVSNGKWGWPDMLHLIDWLPQANLFFFDVAERIYWLTAFVWDILLEGADEAKCRKRLKEIGAPKRGSVRVHNESEIWKAVTPQLGQADIETAARILIWFIGGVGFNLPETYLGWSEGSTYASAKEGSLSVMRTFKTRQTFIKKSFSRIIHFVIDQGKIAGSIPEDADESFNIPFPKVDARDLGSATEALRAVAQALTMALAAGISSRPLAVSLFCRVATELGVDIDVGSEIEAAKAGTVTEEMRETLRLLQELKAVSIGDKLTYEDLLAQANITPEDIEEYKRAWGDLEKLNEG